MFTEIRERKPRSKKHCENLSIALKGRKLSEEHIKNMSKALKGRKLSKKTKDKIRKTLLGTRTGKNSSGWKGGKYKNSDGRWKIYKPEHPFSQKCNYVLQSRLIAERCLGRYLTKIEIIHHINGNKSDDRLKNLYLFESINKHSQYHGYKNKSSLKSNLI